MGSKRHPSVVMSQDGIGRFLRLMNDAEPDGSASHLGATPAPMDTSLCLGLRGGARLRL